MRKSFILITMAMVAALTTVSCKCSSNKSEQQEPTQKEVQEMKQALADTVLAEIDEIAERYWDAQGKSSIIQSTILTDEQKMIKPDYLLDPSIANTLVTKSQKINALAIYVVDIAVCKVYDMPYEELQEVAVKLAADLNVPFDVQFSNGNAPLSEKIKATYNACKERGDVSLFWQFENAGIYETNHIISQSPEVYLGKITDEQWQAFYKARHARLDAVDKLAKYDKEMALLDEFSNNNKVNASKEDKDRKNQSIEFAKHFYSANKVKYAAKRNALLQ